MLVCDVQGVENVYTQHVPYMAKILDQLAKGRLRDSEFPTIPANPKARTALVSTNGTIIPRMREVVVFIVGGATYEEARYVAQWNAGRMQSPTTATASGPNPPFQV